MSVWLPSGQQVLRLYEKLIARTGGSDGVRSLPLIESALNRAAASFGGVDVWPGIEEKGLPSAGAKSWLCGRKQAHRRGGAAADSSQERCESGVHAGRIDTSWAGYGNEPHRCAGSCAVDKRSSARVNEQAASCWRRPVLMLNRRSSKAEQRSCRGGAASFRCASC